MPPAEVPLPEPRPHFAGDPPRSDVSAERAEGKPAEAGSAPDKPAAATDKPAASVGSMGPPVPLPAVKPPEPGPAAPATVAPARVGEAKPAEARPGLAQPGLARPGSAPSGWAPRGATTAEPPRQPDADPGCLARLAATRVEASPVTLSPQPDSRCIVVEPVRLERLTLLDGGAVAFPDRPTLSCTTAATFAAYVRELLAPLAKGSFATKPAGLREAAAAIPEASKNDAGRIGGRADAGRRETGEAAAGGDAAELVAVWTGPGLECRSRDHIFGAKLSAHGQGLAVDIAQIRLGDGRTIAVGTPADERATAFETAARAGACGYFHTVLGPGSDSYHRTHWHFDLELRGRQGDTKFCH